MRKLTFLILLLITFSFNAQNNVFPLPSGNVGIGTTSPSEKLEVNGTIKSTKLKINFANNFSGNVLEIKDNQNFKIEFGVNQSSGYSGMNWTDRNNVTRSEHFFYDNGKYVLVYRNKNNQEFFSLSGDTSDYGNFIHMPQSNSRIVIGDYGNYLFADWHKLVVKEGSAMIEGNILTNSNVGIGTSSFVDGADTYRLSVDGRVRAHAVKVYTDWADFVFEKNYNLPSIEEVEKFINENGHLENIPSAKNVEKNGIELGEMNKLLLQKIEELTLYIIELKKDIDILKSKVD